MPHTLATHHTARGSARRRDGGHALAALTVLLLLPGLLGGCAGLDIEAGDTAAFAGGDYRYYAWRRPPLEQEGRRFSPIYAADPVIRREIGKRLAALGYREDAAQADFLVDYTLAEGTLEGAVSSDAGNTGRQPAAIPNRGVDQAVIDNAYALGSVRTTNRLAILFFDGQSRDEIWRAQISKIVEDANEVNEPLLGRAIERALKALPAAR